MSFASKLNKGGNVFYYRLPEGAEYLKLKDLDPTKIYEIKGFWINEKTEFGPAATMICDGFGVNLPDHLLQTVRDILADPDQIEAVNAGTAGFRVRQAENRKGQKFLSVEWMDL